jgi:hypothetical protein
VALPLGSKNGMAVLLLAVLVTMAACGGSDASNGAAPSSRAPGPRPEWPAPEDAVERTRAAGLEPERREQLQTHRHTHLDVFFNGAAVTVPAAIGIDATDPGVRRFDEPDGPAYGGIEECVNPCISPIHTHDETGIVHTESTSDEIRELGQFFLEWGVRLDDDCVGDYCTPATDLAVYVDGDRFRGNPADIRLTDRTEVAIVIGSPPQRIPNDADFSRA